MSTAEPVDLSKTPIHIPCLGAKAGESTGQSTVLADFSFDGPSFMGYIDKYCSDEQPGRLVMIETTPVDWATWECHPEGDELVIVLEGERDFIQQLDGTEVRIPVKAGDTVLNPAGVWHSADVRASIRAVYITPCPGTDHKTRG